MVAWKDWATKLLTFIADVSVSGHPEVRGRNTLKSLALKPVVPVLERTTSASGKGSKARIDRLGSKCFASWIRNEKRMLVTNTTMRDAHQPLLATTRREKKKLRASLNMHLARLSSTNWGIIPAGIAGTGIIAPDHAQRPVETKALSLLPEPQLTLMRATLRLLLQQLRMSAQASGKELRALGAP